MMRIALVACVLWTTMFRLGSLEAAAPAKWISGDTASPECAAPCLSQVFTLPQVPQAATLRLAVAGWCEVRINGRKCGQHVLEPVTCQPDRRLGELTYDVAELLRMGENKIEVVLGNGWFNCFTRDVWRFFEAPWKASPKMRGTLVVDGAVALVTDGSWRVYDSPIVFNALRNGEWYDARLEGTCPNERAATVEKYAPSGAVAAEDAEPCVVTETYEPRQVLKDPQGNDIYDFGVNLTGWCEFDILGERGAKVAIDYDESLTPSNTLLGHVGMYFQKYQEPRPYQHDEYTLAGRETGESWHPRFTYHGFRYARVVKSGKAQIRAIRARFVHSGFQSAGHLSTSDATFAALQRATCRSYLCNFTGIPTDCPHREKNGWTGDAQLALETGLWNFDARKGYVHFLRMLLDAQRPNGAIPCIVPHSPAFGFYWGSGPAWDMALFEIPEQLYRFYGDDAPAREAYSAMKRYLSYIEGQADADGLFAFGLADWCPYKRTPTASLRMTDSAYVYEFNRRLSLWAEKFGEAELAETYRQRASEIKVAFTKAFYRGDGVYEKGRPTSLACALYFPDLCVDDQATNVARRLVEVVRADRHLATFGILGAKWVPRMLAKYGYIDDAWKLLTQPDMPGWAHWLTFGEETLRENWDDSNSHNHIMFGDLSAWAYEYVAGIVPLEPGFTKIALRPHPPKGVDTFEAVHRTPVGEIRLSWKRVNGQLVYDWQVPPGIVVQSAP